MKIYWTILSACLCLNTSLAQNKRGAIKQIIKICSHELNLDENVLKPRYENKKLIELLNERKFSLNVDTLLNKLLNEVPIYIEIEGYKFEPYSNETYLKNKEGKRLSSKIWKSTRTLEGLHTYTISSPIFSINKKIACLYLNTNCGPLCGSGALLFFRLEEKRWIFLLHKVLFIA